MTFAFLVLLTAMGLSLKTAPVFAPAFVIAKRSK